jgi:hypothetical protein
MVFCPKIWIVYSFAFWPDFQEEHAAACSDWQFYIATEQAGSMNHAFYWTLTLAQVVVSLPERSTAVTSESFSP